MLYSTNKATFGLLYQSLFSVALRHPEYVEELGEIQGQFENDIQILEPMEHLQIATGVMWDPRLDRSYKARMMHGLGYALRWTETPEYELSMNQRLNFNDQKNFYKS